jgi:hypothetical protein
MERGTETAWPRDVLQTMNCGSVGQDPVAWIAPSMISAGYTRLIFTFLLNSFHYIRALSALRVFVESSVLRSTTCSQSQTKQLFFLRDSSQYLHPQQRPRQLRRMYQSKKSPLTKNKTDVYRHMDLRCLYKQLVHSLTLRRAKDGEREH